MKVYQYTHTGTRDNQEDATFTGNGIYVVCDGMGGHAKGEVASNFITGYIAQNAKGVFTKQSVQDILVLAQEELNEVYGFAPETTGMGTTFCGIFTSVESLYMAYAGDSRIYWVRPSAGKVWHTWDHSLVGELVRQGDITREEGRKHPMSNRISRAFVANGENKTVVPDIFRADNVAQGDIFLICSDGVTEAWNDNDLIALLCNTDMTAEQKLNKIRHQCAVESKDNNTAILLEAESNDVIKNGVNDEIEWLPVADFDVQSSSVVADHDIIIESYNEEVTVIDDRSGSKPVFYIIILALLIAILYVLKRIFFK